MTRSAIFASPAFPVPVETREKWQTVLSDLAGYRDVTTKVTQVTDDAVYLAFSGGTAPEGAPDPDRPVWRTRGHRIAGLAVLNRHRGWVARQMVTREGKMEIAGCFWPVRL